MHLLLAVSLLFSTLTNADIVKLVQAGLSPETIEARIAASSDTGFDISTDALVALASQGVPDRVIRTMITRTSAAPPAAAPSVAVAPVSAPGSAPTPAAASAKAFTRRYDVALHTAANARCEGAELRVDGKGISATRCRKLDFNLRWAEVKSLCHEYGFRGVVTVKTAGGEHRFSTVTPAEAKRIVEHVRSNAPAVPVAACRR
jgi:hypothetical protein